MPSAISSIRVPEFALVITSFASWPPRCPDRLAPQILYPPGYRFSAKPKYAKAPATRKAKPTQPERNAHTADLHLPPEDDMQEVRYRHDEKEPGGYRHISFSVQSTCLSASTVGAGIATTARETTR